MNDYECKIFQTICMEEDGEPDLVSDLDKYRSDCITKYEMIHNRYILTDDGLNEMKNKFISCAYGTCNNKQCKHFKLLPIGISNKPGRCNAKLYCQRCHTIYDWDCLLDGCAFGTWFPHLFFLVFPDLLPSTQFNGLVKPNIFGFSTIDEKEFKKDFNEELPLKKRNLVKLN